MNTKEIVRYRVIENTIQAYLKADQGAGKLGVVYKIRYPDLRKY